MVPLSTAPNLTACSVLLGAPALVLAVTVTSSTPGADCRLRTLKAGRVVQLAGGGVLVTVRDRPNSWTQANWPDALTVSPTPISLYVGLRMLARCPAEFIQAVIASSGV